MKPNLILLHGALGSMDQFGQWKELLLPFYEVYTFNFSGHGGHVIEDAFTIDRFVEDCIGFMDANGLSVSHVFGYSMGGYVAIKLARDHAARVQCIITLGTKFKWDPESAAKEVRMMNPDIIEQKIPAFAASLAERHMPSDWKTIMRKTAFMMTQLGSGKAMTTADFASIENKVLVCVGTDDHMVSIAESETTAGQLKNGYLKIIEGFRHPLEVVNKKVLASIISEFIGA